MILNIQSLFSPPRRATADVSGGPRHGAAEAGVGRVAADGGQRAGAQCARAEQLRARAPAQA